jgi:hypothetical protein
MCNLSNLNRQLNQWKWYDYLTYFVIIPALMIIIFLLPESIKSSMYLYVSNPTITNMFFSNYVHQAIDHISSNLLMYILAMIVIFNLETNKKRFYSISAIFFIILPFVISYSTLLLFKGATSPFYGYSGIVAAFLGYLLYITYKYVQTKYINNMNSSWVNSYYRNKFESTLLGLFIFINFLLIVFSYTIPLSVFIILVLIIILCIGFNAIVLINIVKMIGSQINILASNRNTSSSLKFAYYAAIFGLTFLLLFSLPTLLPANIHTPDNGVVNILGHYVGYGFAIILCMLIDYIGNIFNNWMINRRRQNNQSNN